MTTPVVVACDALRSDATRWARAADTAQQAALAAERLALDVDKIGYAARERGVVAAYDALQRKIIQLLAGGKTELDGLATTLRQVADTYQHEDDLGAHGVVRAAPDMLGVDQ